MESTKVVILCGGKGTRSYPFTEFFPKVMMPIGGTPILVHLMRLYAAQGFSDFILAAGYRQEVLRDYFDGRFADWNTQIVDTGEWSDTGERIRRCLDYVGDSFFATYGDGLGNIDLRDLLEFHQGHGELATVTSVPLRSQYGTVRFGDGGRVIEFIEKPVIDGYWISAGFFVFDKKAFDHPAGESLERAVLPSLAARGALCTYRHTGFWKSMDTTKDQQEMDSIYNDGTAPWLHIQRM